MLCLHIENIYVKSGVIFYLKSVYFLFLFSIVLKRKRDRQTNVNFYIIQTVFTIINKRSHYDRCICTEKNPF